MAVIDFINAENKTYQGMQRAINYILNPSKTSDELVGGHNCDFENAYFEFAANKEHYHKENGRQFIHFVQSFAPYEKVTPEMVREIGNKLMKADLFKGFQVVSATHTDKDHLHTHFIIDTVNKETGLKWKQSREALQQIKDYSDKLCRENGLQIVAGSNGSYEKRGQFRSKEKGQSWKYELYLTVNECMRNSTSKEHFVSNMKSLGYDVNWTEERKYITFTNPEGKKCRNRKLYPPERFTKENLLKTFELNQRYQDKTVLGERMEVLRAFISNFERGKVDGSTGTNYPLSEMEGLAMNEKIIENKKGRGLDWNEGHEA